MEVHSTVIMTNQLSEYKSIDTQSNLHYHLPTATTILESRFESSQHKPTSEQSPPANNGLKFGVLFFRLTTIAEQHTLKHPDASDADLNFVSIHVRRADYLRSLEGNGFPEVDLNYYYNAMKYFRDKYKVNFFNLTKKLLFMYFVNVGTCSEIHLSVVPAKLSPNAAFKLELTLSTYILILVTRSNM